MLVEPLFFPGLDNNKPSLSFLLQSDYIYVGRAISCVLNLSTYGNLWIVYKSHMKRNLTLNYH